jgi:hypothetical protein
VVDPIAVSGLAVSVISTTFTVLAFVRERPRISAVKQRGTETPAPASLWQLANERPELTAADLADLAGQSAEERAKALVASLAELSPEERDRVMTKLLTEQHLARVEFESMAEVERSSPSHWAGRAMQRPAPEADVVSWAEDHAYRRVRGLAYSVIASVALSVATIVYIISAWPVF